MSEKKSGCFGDKETIFVYNFAVELKKLAFLK